MASEMLAMRVEDFLNIKPPEEKSTISKPIDYEIDPGNLLAVDPNDIERKELRKNKEQFLLDLTKDGIQILLNTLGQLPVDETDRVAVVKLPEPTTRLPREKVVPKPKQPTKWEQFARLKGIQKKKKGRMVWDQESQEYKPRWGYKSKGAAKSWALEVPENADPMEDQFEKIKKEKAERMAKNERQRLLNIARNSKTNVRGVGLTPTATPSKQQLETALAVTHHSTASLGQFTERLPKEKIKQKKRKFLGNEVSSTEEKEKQRKILKKMAESRSVVDVNRAANTLQHQEERQRAASKKAGDGQKKAGSKGGKKGKGGKDRAKFGKGKGKKFGGKKRH